jgi:hypothetical protein
MDWLNRILSVAEIKKQLEFHLRGSCPNFSTMQSRVLGQNYHEEEMVLADTKHDGSTSETAEGKDTYVLRIWRSRSDVPVVRGNSLRVEVEL